MRAAAAAAATAAAGDFNGFGGGPEDAVYDVLGSDSVTTPSSGDEFDVDDNEDDIDKKSMKTMEGAEDFASFSAAAAARNTLAYDYELEAAVSSSDDDNDGMDGGLGGCPPPLRDFCSVAGPRMPLSSTATGPPFGYRDSQNAQPFLRNVSDLLVAGVASSSRDGPADPLASLSAWSAAHCSSSSSMDPLVFRERQRSELQQQQLEKPQPRKRPIVPSMAYPTTMDPRVNQRSELQQQQQRKKMQRRREAGVRAVIRARDVVGNRGHESVDSLLSFIVDGDGNKKKANIERAAAASAAGQPGGQQKRRRKKSNSKKSQEQGQP